MRSECTFHSAGVQRQSGQRSRAGRQANRRASESEHCAYPAHFLKSGCGRTCDLLNLAVPFEDLFDNLFDKVIDRLYGGAAVITRPIDSRKQHCAVRTLASPGFESAGIEETPDSFLSQCEH